MSKSCITGFITTIRHHHPISLRWRRLSFHRTKIGQKHRLGHVSHGSIFQNPIQLVQDETDVETRNTQSLGGEGEHHEQE